MKNYAIVVGIDDYKGNELEGAVGDATDFGKWLVESGQIPGDDAGKKESERQLKLILSSSYPNADPPTDQEINNAVRDIFYQVKNSGEQGEKLYFYFAGHGLGLTFLNTALCMRPWTSFLNGACISSLKYLERLADLRLFKEIIFFIDCCRNADVLATAQEPQWNQPPLQGVNTKYVVCYSTKFGEQSQEIGIDSSKKRGAFTTFLLRALRGDASNDQGQIHAAGLIKHLKDHFQSFTTSLPYVQMADAHFSGDDFLIASIGNASVQHNFEITFRRDSSRIILFDKDLVEKKSGAVAKGDKWEVVLPVGLNSIVDADRPVESSDREKVLKNYSLNTITHEQF